MSLLQVKEDTKALLNKITAGVIIGTVVVWLAWDVYVSAAGADTESRILSDWSTWTIAFPYAVAMLLGHWWWPWRGEKSPYVVWRTVLNFSVLGLLIVWDILNATVGTPESLMVLRRPEYWCVAGYPMGHFFWGQRNTEPNTKES